jgi:hypothetical protein
MVFNLSSKNCTTKKNLINMSLTGMISIYISGLESAAPDKEPIFSK